jgi:transcriptional regulator with XRE-family HTH domain
MKIKDTIKYLRRSLVLEQKEFADLLGIDKSSICNYEHGARKPRLPIIRKMLELAKQHKIKISPEDFLN